MPECEITIFVGVKPFGNADITILGDTRGNELSYGRLLNSSESANPINCCALAGYLGFAARESGGHSGISQRVVRGVEIRLPFIALADSVPDFSVLGAGQVGQAFLALYYFLAAGKSVSVHLLDKDYFENVQSKNSDTAGRNPQKWNRKSKVEYLAEGLSRMGLECSSGTNGDQMGLETRGAESSVRLSRIRQYGCTSDCRRRRVSMAV